MRFGLFRLCPCDTIQPERGHTREINENSEDILQPKQAPTLSQFHPFRQIFPLSMSPPEDNLSGLDFLRVCFYVCFVLLLFCPSYIPLYTYSHG